ncbi:DUF59 domain-containing protein [Allosaccharopolyspora coralli]|uniref:DUF59 domain-containing protein n=1 Tax=Allosaccharopolyspora coralli TaxID=2665642 RepID=A0A5Q3Q634_9PSEU|nr:iron-sulfur cluster assembly protein [Allosaccharopolyspora coralli]QGK69932.1 DUF59 domain-containing protein [Allosaccharopolyspora coralli]
MTVSLDRAADITAAARSALGTVQDPELAEPLTDLGFVSRCSVSPDGEATVRLRLPTYFCAPNFAFLMVADAHDAVAAVPGVRRVDVRLEDHFSAEAINRGVAQRSGFAASFTGEATDELDELRANFLRKAVLAGTDRVCRAMVSAGADPQRLVEHRLGDAPEGTDKERLRERRRELDLPCDDDTPLLVDPESGAAVGADHSKMYLARARLTRTGQEANAGMCRGMLQARYPQTPQEE